ncbi:MAG TPA: hypothetical protein VFG81_07245 [Anaerolineales bacterium]|jgi:hypothetical protein|nr:hypothetical protein [Anaerolineales bacterium]
MTNTTILILVAIVALIVGALLVMAFNRFQRTRRLRDRFGPEYERIVNEAGDRQKAESELEARLAHVEALHIRPLSAEEVNRFSLEWQAIQAEFVDEPLASLQKADRLIREAMKAKGYPVEDFEQRAADISVDYPELVADYRGLHLIATKEADEKVSTEEMRQAMVHGRDLFENLVGHETAEASADEKEKIQ